MLQVIPRAKHFPGGFHQDIPPEIAQAGLMKRSYFDVPLVDRLQENVEFVRRLAQLRA